MAAATVAKLSNLKVRAVVAPNLLYPLDYSVRHIYILALFDKDICLPLS
jgi:hypothetical protein